MLHVCAFTLTRVGMEGRNRGQGDDVYIIVFKKSGKPSITLPYLPTSKQTFELNIDYICSIFKVKTHSPLTGVRGMPDAALSPRGRYQTTGCLHSYGCDCHVYRFCNNQLFNILSE